MTRFLLDTHVWLWMQTEPERIAAETRAIIDTVDNELLLSAASSWEIAIKYRIGKLPLPEPPHTYVPERLRRSDTTPLAVEHAHALRVAELPEHHKDPFDRLIIAQAQLLEMPVITADETFDSYEVDVIAA